MTRYFATNPQEIRLTVSAVVWRAVGSREILLMKRSDNGRWGLPGGHVDPGESVAQATVREVAEETGFRVDVGRLIGVYSDPERQTVSFADPDERAVQFVNLCFEARPLSQGDVTTPEETLDVGFFPHDALPDPFVPIHSIRIEDAVDGIGAARIR